jgi:hypothetical protein
MVSTECSRYTETSDDDDCKADENEAILNLFSKMHVWIVGITQNFQSIIVGGFKA